MTLELSLIIGFILHFVGDYLTQNDWMAQNKTKRFFPAFVHATIYSLPFLWICPSHWWWLIYVTHFFIDHYRLVRYWIKLVNWEWRPPAETFGPIPPLYLSFWLTIIMDNTFHVLINSVSIWLAFG